MWKAKKRVKYKKKTSREMQRKCFVKCKENVLWNREISYSVQKNLTLIYKKDQIQRTLQRKLTVKYKRIYCKMQIKCTVKYEHNVLLKITKTYHQIQRKRTVKYKENLPQDSNKFYCGIFRKISLKYKGKLQQNRRNISFKIQRIFNLFNSK